MNLRPAVPADAAALTALALRSKALWGYDAAFMAACRDELTVTPRDVTTAPTVVAEQDGSILGFYRLTFGGGEAEVVLFFVEPEAVGQGIGRALWADMLVRARAHGATRLTIDADPNAAGFYRRMGARPAGSVAATSVPGRRLPRFVVELQPAACAATTSRNAAP